MIVGYFETRQGNIATIYKGGKEGSMAATPEGIAAAHKLKEYWVHGPGAVKIAWGTPHDF